MGKDKKDRKEKSRSRDDDREDRKKRKKLAGSEDESDDREDRKKVERGRERRKKKDHRKRKSSSKRRKRSPSSSSSSSSDSSSDESHSERKSSKKKTVVNERLVQKLEARGETLEERRERRGQKRAALITTKFGYTTEENPFNDPNLHEKFTWKKREEQQPEGADQENLKKHDNTFGEIDKVRKRRKDRELQNEEMERIRAEESRMKELENYDDWARKEEDFHLQQQRQRSAIRLVEGREKPVDVLAKNLLLFGLSEEDKKNRAAVKYQEKYNVMEALESLEAELEEPHNVLKMLKLNELEELRVDVDAFRMLEREAATLAVGISYYNGINPILQFWDALKMVVDDEIKFLKTGGAKGTHAKMAEDVRKIFKGQSTSDLLKMKEEVDAKLRDNVGNMEFDRTYWYSVTEQLDVFLAKATLSEQHSMMLVRQLEKLEDKREELAQQPEIHQDDSKPAAVSDEPKDNRPENAPIDGDDLEEELGLTNEIDLTTKAYSWQDKYRPRKPRFFNRVKTGWDWNKYNQTHYDKDTPPPKTVQGYKFNIFYTDLIDPTKTPTFKLEPTDSEEFCIIRFTAGAPYEDIAFKIINREWNRSRKRGFKCTFERGVLSLYFNFATHWYRR
jgi:hypothetical protein